MMAHKRSLERKSAGGQGMAQADPLQQPAGSEEEGEQDGAQVAAEHGPAHEVHLTHDHEAGCHHVHSLHPDGHEHHSEHASADEAHDHAKQLASEGGEQESGDEEDNPEFE